MLTAEMLQREAQELRITVIDMIYKAGSGHSGGSLSSIEILLLLRHSHLITTSGRIIV